MVVTRVCPKCKKIAAKYTFNAHGILAFTKCHYCGYDAEQYAKDLKEKK